MRRPARSLLLLLLAAAATGSGAQAVGDDCAGCLGVVTFEPRCRECKIEQQSEALDALLDQSFQSREAAWSAINGVLTTGIYDLGQAVGQAAYDVAESDMRLFWAKWKVRYRKNYGKNDGIIYSRFSINVRRIAKDLNDVTRPNWADFGPRLDLPPGPFNGGIELPPDFGVEGAVPSSPSTIMEWDWRRLGKVTAAKDQGECLGCWAFAAVGAVESLLLISSDSNTTSTPQLDLSEQQLLDCASRATGFQSRGCAGGWLTESFTYASSQLGRFLTTESSYPFNPDANSATPPTCNATQLSSVQDDQKYVLSDVGYTLLEPWYAQALREAVLEQPVVVSIYAPVEFAFYGGGLWRAQDCGLPPVGPPTLDKVLDAGLLTHSLLVVGFNLTARPPYWIVKNSLGPEWGEQGFGYMEITGLQGEQSYGTCLMYSWMVKPTEVVPWQASTLFQQGSGGANAEVVMGMEAPGPAPVSAPAPAPAPTPALA